MAVIIKPKRSDTSGNAPSAVDGELTIQRADKRILVANSTVVWDAFQNTVSNIAITNATGQFSVGNSTINAIINNTSMSLVVNSTTRFIIVAPSAADYAAPTKFLSSNGSFLTPSGGSASAGGPNTSIQFNDSTALNGNTNFTYDKSTNTVALNGTFNANADYISVGNSSVSTVVNSTYIITGNSSVNTVVNSTYIVIGNSTINSVSNSISCQFPIGPLGANIAATPTFGAAFYSKYRAGRSFAHVIDNTGWDVPMDCHPIHTTVHSIFPTGNTTTLTTIRCGAANSTATTGGGVLAAPAPTNANLYMSQTRVLVSANATAGDKDFLGSTTACFWRGNAANSGGFYAVFRFGLEKAIANTVFFIGFNSTNTVLSNVNPSTLTNLIGFGINQGQTNLYAISANSTAATNTDLTGMNFTTAQTNWYEGILYAMPNGGNVYYQLTNIGTGAVANGQFNATNLPANNQTLAFKVNVSNFNQAVNTNIGFGGVQIEVPN